MHQVEILRKCFIKGQVAQPGDVVELDTYDYNAFLYMGKARDLPVGQPPVADQREEELTRRMHKRDLPQPPGVDIVQPDDDDEEEDDDGGDA